MAVWDNDGMPGKHAPTEDRLWRHVERSEEGCWLWLGKAKSAGYGVLRVGGRGGRTVLAHRLSWELHNGPIPDGLWVLHHCDVRACVRPDHLWLGTQQDNNADCKAKGRQARGDTRGFNKVSSADVRAIRALIAAGWTQAVIAPLFHITREGVSAIATRRNWHHID